MQISNPSFSYLPHRRISSWIATWSLLTGLSFILPMMWVLHFLPASWSGDPTAFNERAADVIRFPISFFFKAVIFVPILEELAFRGLILQSLRRFAPVWLAVGFTSIFFGITHLGFNVTTALFATGCGFYFSWLVMQSRSLFPSMLCHSAVNFSAWFIFFPMMARTGATDAYAFSKPLLWLLNMASMLLFINGVNILAREFRRENSVPAPRPAMRAAARSSLKATC